MKRDIINPWNWQEALGFVHGNKVSQPENLLFMAGQTASDDDGHTLHEGDMAGQITQVTANIEKVLSDAGMSFEHVVRLNVYTTDMEKMLAAHDHMVQLLRSKDCRHAGTLLGVTALAAPGALVEMEVTAAA